MRHKTRHLSLSQNYQVSNVDRHSELTVNTTYICFAYLCSTFLPILYLSSTYHVPMLYLSSTCTLPILYLCSTYPLSMLYLSSTYALPMLYLCSTYPLPMLYMVRLSENASAVIVAQWTTERQLPPILEDPSWNQVIFLI